MVDARWTTSAARGGSEQHARARGEMGVGETTGRGRRNEHHDNDDEEEEERT